MWRNRSAAAEPPSAVNQLTSAFNSPAPSTKGRHFLVICCENKAIFLDLVTMRGRDVPKQDLDNRSLVWQVTTTSLMLLVSFYIKHQGIFIVLMYILDFFRLKFKTNEILCISKVFFFKGGTGILYEKKDFMCFCWLLGGRRFRYINTFCFVLLLQYGVPL